MVALPVFQIEAPSPPLLLYCLVVALLVWAGYATWLARQLRRVRRQSNALSEQQDAAAVEAAAGQPDQPSKIDSLQLGIAPVLVNLLTHPRTKEPYTIALSGGWGSGKSSVMQQIEEELRIKKVRFKAVDINVWHFQQEDQLLTAFLQKILEELNDWRFRWKQIRKNLRGIGFWTTFYRAGLLGLALPVLLLTLWVLVRDASQYLGLDALLLAFRQSGIGQSLAAALHAPFYVLRHLPDALPSDKQSTSKSWGDPAGLFAIFTVVGSVVAALRSMPELMKPLLQLVPYKQQYEMAQGPAGLRQRYQRDFRTIIQDAADETLLIFVDDIDRISGSRVLELLETLNFIVTSAVDYRNGGASGAKLYFVLAMNVPEVVRVLGPALDPTQQLAPAVAQLLAANYLSKLVDLTVNIPSLQGRNINSLYETATSAS
ncbi:hypothetical protein H8B15_13300 [Hymenobacter sp. BT507]|uniref:KAP NTPase domain-containing protein n=1 Tax=Hymenobacter citatus TaxID=2763506 RepID=A0ABR7MLD9_9BACT|nr:P-loop NTPase fold protein [Hymenobacter citatus]MBC6611904.1 hypothetical protein [Hymenobacter citatus]